MAEARVGGAFWDPSIDPWADAPPPTDENLLIARLRQLTELSKSSEDASLLRKVAFDLLLDGIDYRDPFTAQPISPEAAIRLLGFWRQSLDRLPGQVGHVVAAAGIARWKRREVRQLLWTASAGAIRFVESGEKALAITNGPGDAILGWPSRISQDLPSRADEAGIPYYNIEDGFIRSVGLGADCHPPFSVVIDRQGIHYDPSRPSDLETLLQTTDFSPELLARTDALIEFIVTSRISKYGVGIDVDLPARTRRRILVTGQVEDDLAVLSGGGGVKGNLDLIIRARTMEPDAEIWFKPHPDVDAGHRAGRVRDTDALRHADRVIRETSMSALFEAIDAIHVLTSLAGFEALLRKVEVVTHGVPFYAGWGLTRDFGPVPARRTRTLSLSELAAGVLLLYPFYLDPVTNLPCPPEILIRRLSDQRKPQETWLTRLRHLQGKLRRMASELKV